MTSEKTEYLCDKCDYPAQSQNEFMDPKTQSIINYCPMCGETNTKTQKIFNFRLVWDMIHGMGLDRQLSEISDIYLQLQEYNSYNPPKHSVSVDIPDDVREELSESIQKAQTILNRADITNFLKEINVLIIINANTSR